MDDVNALSRRKFVGGLAAALGYVSTGPSLDVFAQAPAGQGRPGGNRVLQTEDQYDALAKLANNENNYGIPDSVMQAMTSHWKYAGRYGYPDPGINQAIAEFDGVKPENIMEKLQSTMDGEANLLDKTLILYGSPMAVGNTHNHRNCPFIVLGRGGILEGGTHIKAAKDTPMANVMLSLLHKLGLEDLQSFGDSTGEFSFKATETTVA